MSTPVQHRRDTAANWTSVNPTLLSGQLGIETDTNKFKLGDGSTAWNTLAYAAGEGGGGVTAGSIGNPAAGSVYPSSNGLAGGTKVSVFSIQALAQNITIEEPVGSWSHGEELVIAVVDAGVAKTLTFDAAYVPVNVAMPSVSPGNANKVLYLKARYNALSYGTHTSATWDVVAIAVQA